MIQYIKQYNKRGSNASHGQHMASTSTINNLPVILVKQTTFLIGKNKGKNDWLIYSIADETIHFRSIRLYIFNEKYALIILVLY